MPYCRTDVQGLTCGEEGPAAPLPGGCLPYHHYGKRVLCCVSRHTAKAKVPMANPLPCVAHGKRHTANRRRQIGHLSCAIYRAHGKEFAECQKTHGINIFRKLILKIENKKN